MPSFEACNWAGMHGEMKGCSWMRWRRHGWTVLTPEIFRYPLAVGRVRITPKIGVRWWSGDMANYYYGIRPREVARGAPALYTVSSVLVPDVGVNVIAPLSHRWSRWGALRYQHLPSEMADSPLVVKSSTNTFW